MNAVSRYNSILLSISVIVSYFICYFLLGSQSAKLIIDALVLGASVTIFLSWGRVAMGALIRGAHSGEDKIVLTIWLAWTVLMIQRVYVIVYAIMGKPEWVMELPIGGVISTLIFLSGMFAVFAPVTPELGSTTPLPRSILIACTVGAFVSGVIVAAYFLRGFTL